MHDLSIHGDNEMQENVPPQKDASSLCELLILKKKITVSLHVSGQHTHACVCTHP